MCNHSCRLHVGSAGWGALKVAAWVATGQTPGDIEEAGWFTVLLKRPRAPAMGDVLPICHGICRVWATCLDPHAYRLQPTTVAVLSALQVLLAKARLEDQRRRCAFSGEHLGWSHIRCCRPPATAKQPAKTLQQLPTPSDTRLQGPQMCCVYVRPRAPPPLPDLPRIIGSALI